MLVEILDLLLVLIDCLHNLINLFHRCEFSRLCGIWNLLIGYDHFLLQSLHAYPLLFGLKLGLLEYPLPTAVQLYMCVHETVPLV
jgi:hypothetical protein